MAKDLTNFFSPKSVAVIGASRRPEKVGAIVLKNIIESKYQGKIYPVNPNAEEVSGLKCFKDVSGLPEVPDLAVVAIPAQFVLETLNRIGEKGIKNVVVISAGFKEIGPAGEKLENELIEIAKKYELNVLGPNCLGFVNNLCPINVTFGQIASEPGNLRFISQSGALATALFDWCKSTGLGFSEFVTLGNKAVLNENDILQYFQSANLPENGTGLSNTRPIGLYLESIADGVEFVKITKEISRKNPVFIIKPGKTSAGASAMQSHTGAIAGSDSVLSAALSEADVIRCETLEEFFDLSRAFSFENIPGGDKVAIISNAGGPAVISADAIISEGLELVDFDDQTKSKLLEVLPGFASIHDPVDVLGDALADRYTKAAEIILQNPGVDTLMVILTPQVMTQIEQTAVNLGELSKKYQKPIFCSFLGGSRIAEGEQKLNEYKIPTFRFPERAISAIASMWKFKKHQGEIQTSVALTTQQDFSKAKEVIEQALKENLPSLDNFDADKVSTEIGISTPPTIAINNLEEANKFVENNGFPVVLKLSSPGLLHKKKVGGVAANIENEKDLKKAFEKMEQNISKIEIKSKTKIQIQKQIKEGVEVIIGVKYDPNFGGVLLFGAGGSLAELIADRNLRLLPIDNTGAMELVEKSKIFSVLSGEQVFNLDKLYQTMTTLASLAQSCPQISEIEINPAIITDTDVWAVDTKVILKEEEKPAVLKFQEATVLSHTVLASTYHFLVFESSIALNFLPGQNISVKVGENKMRSYSIAGHNGPNTFSLLVDIKPGGPGSLFFQNLKVGDKIVYLGPFGTFTLKTNDDSKHLLFLATGCGLSPLKCMIEEVLNEMCCKLPVTLYFGLSTEKDVFMQDYFGELSKKYPNFNFKIAVFKPGPTWTGYTGFITQFLKPDLPDASECSAYLSGNQQMIADASDILKSQGLPEERIYKEKY